MVTLTTNALDVALWIAHVASGATCDAHTVRVGSVNRFVPLPVIATILYGTSFQM